MKPRLNYSKHGEEGPLVVALHGFMGSSRDWDFLKQLPIRLLAIDLPGHGESLGLRPVDYEIETSAQLVMDILMIEEAQGCHLLGYSMGGRIAMWLAVHCPTFFNQVIIESSSPGMKFVKQRADRVAHDQLLAKKLVDMGMEPFLQDWYGQLLFKSLADRPDLLERLVQSRLTNQPEELAKALIGSSVGNQESCWDELPNLSVPVSVFHGELDRKYQMVSEDMVSLSNKIKAVKVPDAGHNTHLENPEAFVDLLRPLILERN